MFYKTKSIEKVILALVFKLIIWKYFVKFVLVMIVFVFLYIVNLMA